MPMLKLTAADGHEFSAYEAGNVNAPRGLVVVQEIFGVNAHMRSVSERLASHGYRVLCPRLFDRAERNVELGYEPADIEKGRELRSRITEAQALLDLKATAAAFGGKPVGIIGYCWGGTLAWLGATKMEAFWAASGWYGAGIAAQRDLTPNCPVQLHFGEHDHSIPLADVEAIRKAQPGIEVHVYQGAEHGFGCEARASYSRKDWELAELRSLAFFAEHVR
jgi:carboxymethylenebutenolidase